MITIGCWPRNNEKVTSQVMLMRASRLPRKPVVAIVDDYEAVRESLSDLLQVIGLSCRLFDSATSFLAAFAPGRFDCLITDVRMPGLSGVELCERLNALGSSMPVIIITSSIDERERARALEGGAFAWLTKPVGDDTILAYLSSALGCDALCGDEGRRE
jgi:two-component system response regulator FixJ